MFSFIQQNIEYILENNQKIVNLPVSDEYIRNMNRSIKK